MSILQNKKLLHIQQTRHETIHSRNNKKKSENKQLVTNNHIHKILCQCDKAKSIHSHKRAVYHVYASKDYLILRCKTCNKKQRYTLGEELNETTNDDGE